MLNVRYILRLVSAFASRFKLLIFLSIILGVALFFSLRIFLPFIFSGDTQRLGLVGRYTSATLPTGVLRMISGGLTKLDDSGMVEPDLAASWETPDKGKTWIFKLRDGATWQDGKKSTTPS